ncbi:MULTISPECIES: GNAT family N-acetyltransferase [unclassified Lysinibacillus]|uniref:GNAT family N-acetyltransferase n=1 Tax=unclassified Lysinibacillus TaxID=2636778 RepID=UPI00116DFE42|nr:GNAT family N-acetyltransferase [Lysinibacillus sp. CD3-6]QPQ33564.1 GNAT family N-acetyltransferase [Lysinibacillus sp. JNUCC-52]UED80500.1 GNAT family N-acetyltransferase [Lysinibacillus sp. CD3-6]
MKIKLKSITKEDEVFLYEIFASTRHQEVDSWGWSVEQRADFLAMQWRAQQVSYNQQFPRANHWIIVEDAECVGRILTEELPEYHRLIDIAILPKYQGRGIGTYIIVQLQKKAKVQRKAVVLHVHKTNIARYLYERLGFQVIQEDEIYMKMLWK